MKIKKVLSSVLAILLISASLGGCQADTQSDMPVIESTVSVNADLSTELAMSHPSGFYKDSIDLAITASASAAAIYYTMDGSVPDENSILYNGTIKLTDRSSQPNILSAEKKTVVGDSYLPKKPVKKGNVIRAVAVYPDGTKSAVYSNTYFVGIDRAEKYGNVPVISIMTDKDNLFDYEKGIYTPGKTYDDWIKEDEANRLLEAWQAEANFTNRGREWERPVSFEYIGTDGSGINQDLGIRIMGAASRNAFQKSFRLTAREDYGKKSVDFELIPDNERSDHTGNVTKYKSFVLRNGGNDCDYAKIRDPLFHELTKDRRYDTQQTAPCVVFLNGEYWGMYTIVEDYSDNYIENNYGIDNKNVILVKRGELEEGEENDIQAYYDMYDFISENNMAIAENYEKACSMLDMGSYIDMCAMNFYIYNEDSFLKDNNWRMWRVRTPDDTSALSDGKWRCLIYDTDFSAGIYCGGSNFNEDNISNYIKATYHEPEFDEDGEKLRPQAKMLSSLLENEEFMKELVLTMCDMRNYDFSAERALGKAEEYYMVYKDLVPDTFKRFGPGWIAHNDTNRYYDEKITELMTFIDGRYGAMPKIMKRVFGFEDAVSSEISSSDSTKGTVMVNNTMLDLSEPATGKYFKEYPIKVTAVPNGSASFKEWKFSGCTISDPASAETVVTVTGDFTIEAVFE